GVSNDDAVVYSSGGGTPLGGLVDGGTYYFKDAGGGRFFLLTKKSTDPGSAVVDLTSLGSGKSHSIVPSGNAPSGDASALGPRVIHEGTDSFRGVAVTANNTDDVGAFGIGLGFSGTAAVTLAGTVNVDNVHTSAYIGSSAKVNSDEAGANALQSVRVAAASQFYHLGLAASLAIAGTAGISGSGSVRGVPPAPHTSIP